MWLGSSFCCWSDYKPGGSTPAASRAKALGLKRDTEHFGEGRGHMALLKGHKSVLDYAGKETPGCLHHFRRFHTHALF